MFLRSMNGSPHENGMLEWKCVSNHRSYWCLVYVTIKLDRFACVRAYKMKLQVRRLLLDKFNIIITKEKFIIEEIYFAVVNFFRIPSEHSTYVCTKLHALFSALQKINFLEKKNYFVHKNMHGTSMRCLLTSLLKDTQFSNLSVLTSFSSTCIISPYACKILLSGAGNKENKLFQVVCQDLRAVSPAHLDMYERAEKQNV